MQNNHRILTIAEPIQSIDRLLKRVESIGYELIYVKSLEELESALSADNFNIALFNVNGCHQSDSKDMLLTLKQKQPQCQVIGVYNPPVEVTNKEIKEAGVSIAYSAGYEDEFIINSLFEFSPIEIEKEKLDLSLLSRINISELSKESTLPFDVYVCLPANRKILLYRTKGSELNPDTVTKFKKHREYSLYIRKTDLNTYTDFYSKLLNEIQDDPNLSKVEKQKVITKEIKGLMNGFFSADEFNKEESDQILSGMSRVLFDLKDESGSKEALMEPVMDLVSQNMTTFSHSKNVATYCVLFGSIVGIIEPESLKIGGFLHDIGLSDFDPNSMFKNYEDLTPEEFAQYKLHPGNAKLSLMHKKLEVPELSLKMILQHHEHPDGSGFPYGLTSEAIDPAAKICAFADHFDKLTSVRFGYVKFKPIEAIQRIAGLDGSEPAPYFEKEFHQPIVDFFLNNTETPSQIIEDTPSEKEPSSELVHDLLKDLPTEPKVIPVPESNTNEPSMADLFAAAMSDGSEREKPVTAAAQPEASQSRENSPDADTEGDLVFTNSPPKVVEQNQEDNHSVDAQEDVLIEGKGVKVISEVYQPSKPGFKTLSEIIQTPQVLARTFTKEELSDALSSISEDYNEWELQINEVFKDLKDSAA